MTDQRPKAWIDDRAVPMFRGDVPEDEAEELYAMLHQAFNAGMKRAIEQLRPDNSRPAA